MAFRSDVPDLTKEVTIIINEEDPHATARFTVTEGLLTEHSEFFQAACRDASGEGTTVIKLPQVDPDIFHAYLFWIHRNKIAFNTDFASQGVSGKDLYPTSLGLVMLWLLADRLTTSKLRNDVIEALHRVLDGLDRTQGSPTDIFPASMTALVWPATTAGRSLRKLVVGYYATKVPIPVIDQYFDEYHLDFVQELMEKIMEIHQITKANTATPQVSGNHHQEGVPNPPQSIQAVAQPSPVPAPTGSVSIVLKDNLGNILHAQGPLFAAPKKFIDSILPKLQGETVGDKQASIKVALQFPNNTSQSVDKSVWSNSFGHIIRESGQHFGRGAFAFKFNGGSFPENMGYEGIFDHQLLCPLRT